MTRKSCDSSVDPEARNRNTEARKRDAGARKRDAGARNRLAGAMGVKSRRIRSQFNETRFTETQKAVHLAMNDLCAGV